MPALVVREGPAAGRRVEIEAETEIGRVATGFLRDDAEVSGRHAVVRVGPAGLEIEDLGSANGTFVNGERVTGRRSLVPGDRIGIGRSVFELDTVEEPRAGGTVTVVTPAAPHRSTQVGDRFEPRAPLAPPHPVGEPGSEPAPPVGRPASVVAAAVLLILAAIVSAAAAAMALVNNASFVLDAFDIVPLDLKLFYILLVPGMILAILQLLGAVGLLGLKGRGPALASTILAVALWSVELSVVGGAPLDYLVIGIVVALDATVVILVMAAGRRITVSRDS